MGKLLLYFKTRKARIFAAIFPLLLPILIFVILLIAASINSKYIKQKSDEYFKAYCKQWANSLTYNDDPQWFVNKTNIDITNDVDAIMSFAYYSGWDVWNNELHANKGTVAKDHIGKYKETSFQLPYVNKPFPFFESFNLSLKYDDYKKLDDVLKKCQCGPITTYHGMEINEKEILNQILSFFNLDNVYDWTIWEKANDQLLSLDLNQLKEKEIDYYAFCATSLDKDTAWSFLVNGFAGFNFHNVIFYEIEVDENTYGAYISHQDTKFYNRTLAWEHEYQLLLSCNLKLKIKDAFWTKTIEGQNVLYLKTKGYHNE